MKKILLAALAALMIATPLLAGTGGDRFCYLYIFATNTDSAAKNGLLLDNVTTPYSTTVAGGAGARGARGAYNLAPWDTLVTQPFPAQGINAAYAMFKTDNAADTIGLNLVKMQVSEDKTNWTDVDLGATATGMWQVNTTGIGGSMVSGRQTGWVAGVSYFDVNSNRISGGLPPSPWSWARIMLKPRGITRAFNVKFVTVKDNAQ